METGEDVLPAIYFHLTAIMAVILLQPVNVRGLYPVTSCSLGHEFECRQKVEGAESSLCEPICNTTIAERLSPGSCSRSCCKMCYKECHLCFYVTILQVNIMKTQWTSDFLVEESNAFKLLESKIQIAVKSVLNTSQISGFKLQLLSAKKLSQNNTIQVILQMTCRNQGDEDKAIAILLRASHSSNMGDIKVERDSVVLMDSTSKGSKQNVGIDFVELAVTCAAGALLAVAVGIFLFYCCTTASQRRRYKKCCRKHGVQQNPRVAET